MTSSEPVTGPSTIPAERFVAAYGIRADPWGIEGSWYEQRKRDCTLAALPLRRYRRAFEPGCANGALSIRLADRCDRLICWDAVPAAVATTSERLGDRPHVTVRQGVVPEQWPPGHADLVVVSEIAYYFDRTDRDRLWGRVVDALVPGGVLLAVHWLGDAPEHPVTGARVHDELGEVDGIEEVARYRDADFALDVRLRTPPAPRSVAQRSGVR